MGVAGSALLALGSSGLGIFVRASSSGLGVFTIGDSSKCAAPVDDAGTSSAWWAEVVEAERQCFVPVSWLLSGVARICGGTLLSTVVPSFGTHSPASVWVAD